MKRANKLKKESFLAWLASWSLEAADRYQQTTDVVKQLLGCRVAWVHEIWPEVIKALDIAGCLG